MYNKCVNIFLFVLGCLLNMIWNGIVNIGEVVIYDIIKDYFIYSNIMFNGIFCYLVLVFVVGFCGIVLVLFVDVVKICFMNFMFF